MSVLSDVVPSLTLEKLYVAWSKGSTTPTVMAAVLAQDGYQFTPEEVNELMRDLDQKYRGGLPLPW